MTLMQETGQGFVSRRVRAEGNDVANTILQQMGGSGRLKAMIGAKNFMAHENALSFKFPNPKRSLGNYVKIELDAGSDTYSMEFYNGMKSVKKIDGLHAEDLKKAFESQTGLFVSLGTLK